MNGNTMKSKSKITEILMNLKNNLMNLKINLMNL